mgnify:CR=1 FL=1
MMMGRGDVLHTATKNNLGDNLKHHNLNINIVLSSYRFTKSSQENEFYGREKLVHDLTSVRAPAFVCLSTNHEFESMFMILHTEMRRQKKYGVISNVVNNNQ